MRKKNDFGGLISFRIVSSFNLFDCMDVNCTKYNYKYVFYSVTHTGWDFRDDCTDFILSVALQLIFPGTAVNLYIFVQIINKP